MKTSVYIVQLVALRVDDPEVLDAVAKVATVYRHKKNALAVYESYAKSLFSGGLAADEVQFLKYTFTGSAQAVAAKALEVGSVMSRGEYITADPFCDAEWKVEMLRTTGEEVCAT